MRVVVSGQVGKIRGEIVPSWKDGYDAKDIGI